MIGTIKTIIPVEEKGYKRMIKLPDWLDIQKLFSKSIKRGDENVFFSFESAPFCMVERNC
jgi:hypothetical protein